MGGSYTLVLLQEPVYRDQLNYDNYLLLIINGCLLRYSYVTEIFCRSFLSHFCSAVSGHLP